MHLNIYYSLVLRQNLQREKRGRFERYCWRAQHSWATEALRGGSLMYYLKYGGHFLAFVVNDAVLFVPNTLVQLVGCNQESAANNIRQLQMFIHAASPQ